jgi:O-antigen/teichoic acid export membrane protein
MAEDSLRKRYIFKLSTNLIGMMVALVTQAIIPRGLGPRAYGDFNFLTNFFNQFVGFMDMGTSNCFYTKLSQRPRDGGLVAFYLSYSGIISIITLAFVTLLILTPYTARIWPDQSIPYIYLAAGFAILTWVSQLFGSMGDAYGLTARTETTRILLNIGGMGAIVALFFLQQLNLTNFFFYQYTFLALLTVLFALIMMRAGSLTKKRLVLSMAGVRGYVREFYPYSHPLFVYALVSLVVGIFDRWLLQALSGSVQQGFFSLSYQFGAICLLFTSAMTPLLLREFSLAHGKDDMAHMSYLFRRYIPALYSMAAYFACFIAMEADKMVLIFGGDRFTDAVTVVTIMAFYPIHQTYGQLSGSVFLATGQTALYRNIGIVLMLVGLPFTYVMIAPPEKWGIGAGATGLAIKMVILNFVWVNVQLYFNAKFLNLRFWRYVGHQVLSLACLLILASCAVFAVDHLVGSGDHVIMGFLFAGIVYTIMVIAATFLQPAIFGISRRDVQAAITLISCCFGNKKDIDSSD